MSTARRRALPWLVWLAVVLGTGGDWGGCGSAAGADPAGVPRRYSYRVVRVHAHDPQAFTQGLAIDGGVLYEGTGLRGRSWLENRVLTTGEVLRHRDLAPHYFGEGITVFGERLVQLTWTSGEGFVYDKATLEPVGRFRYPGEGWGLTHDGTRLILSDGTAILRFLDPATFAELGRVEVRDRGRPVERLNELEYVRGEVWANVWQTDRIARIDPGTGRVVGWIDLAGLLAPGMVEGPVDVLNGIAYDAAGDRLFVTGKLWPAIFEIRLVPAE